MRHLLCPYSCPASQRFSFICVIRKEGSGPTIPHPNFTPYHSTDFSGYSFHGEILGTQPLVYTTRGLQSETGPSDIDTGPEQIRGRHGGRKCPRRMWLSHKSFTHDWTKLTVLDTKLLTQDFLNPYKRKMEKKKLLSK